MTGSKGIWRLTIREVRSVSTCALLLIPLPTLPQPADELQRWIAEHAVAVRSIDAGDEDFSDLEPLVDAIGSARVVQLGEPGHGAGSSFAAKVRLIKFLHQRMGFEILAWESGMHGLRLTQAGLRAGEDAVAAAQRGIFTIWSATEEVKPLFEYAKASQASIRPLEMTGFDMQFTTEKAAERFSSDLRSFVLALHVPAVRSRASRLADQVIAAHERIYAPIVARLHGAAEASREGKTGKALREAMAAWELREGSGLRPGKESLESLNEAVDGLLATIRSHHTAFEQVHGTMEIAFMERAIENMRNDGASMYERYGPDRPTGPAARAQDLAAENRRDALNASNLRWLMDVGYPGRKFMVWAHNAHVMNAYYAGFAGDSRSVQLAPGPDSMKPSGVFLADWLKEDVYTIVFTTYEGKDGWAITDAVTSIPPAEDGSLESRLHKLGKPHVFLDVRTVSNSPGHQLRTPQSMRLPKYDTSTITDIARVFDAVFYIDRMAPATRIGK